MKKLPLVFLIILIIFSISCINLKKNTSTKQTTNYLKSDITFIDLNQGYKFGNKDAKIIMIEYSSYECIDCRDFHKSVDEILKKYVDDGSLLYVFKPVDHPKFKNDERINMYFVPKNFDDIQNVFNKFDLYSQKSYEEVKSVLKLNEVESSNYYEMNETIKKELIAGHIKGTPTIYINGIKYEYDSKSVHPQLEFEKLLKSQKNNYIKSKINEWFSIFNKNRDN